MSNKYNDLDIYNSIVSYLKERLIKGESVVEWNAPDTDFQAICKEHGVKYSTTDKSGTMKRGLAKKFLICMSGTPFDDIPSGTRMVVITSGYSGIRAYDNLCQDVNHLYQEGAVTIQHLDLFVTYGVRV